MDEWTWDGSVPEPDPEPVPETAPTRDAPCACPGARSMGDSLGVIHPHLRGCDGGCNRMRTYLWVVDGQHLCGRCRYGPGHE